MKRYRIILAMLLFTIGELYSQSEGGGYAESYLLRDVGARSVAMAGACTAVANDPNTIFYNPAGLAGLSAKPNFSSMFSFLDYNRSHSTISWGQSLFENFGVGFGINSYKAGSFTQRDLKGNSLGDMTNWQVALVGGAAYQNEFASIGASVKYLSNSLTNSGTTGNGFAVDIGSKFNIMNMFSFGLAVQNVSGVMFWNTTSQENDLLPYTIRSGVAMEYSLNGGERQSRNAVTGEVEDITEPTTRYLLFSLDAIMRQYENSPTIVLGVEAVVHEIIAFRGGISLLGDDEGSYKLLPMTVWGLGVSIRPPEDKMNLPFNMSIDYSVSGDYLSNNGIAHHLSIQIELK